LADALGELPNTPRSVIAWEGEVKVYENGRIEGAGACKEYRAGQAAQNTTSPVGSGASASGKSVILGNKFTEKLNRYVNGGGDFSNFISRFFSGQKLANNRISGKILTLGEGNFGFSRSLLDRIDITDAEKALFTATEYRPLNQLTSQNTVNNLQYLQQQGVRHMGGIDAARLSTHFPNERFDVAFFNFPFVLNAAGNGTDVNATINLIRNFILDADRVINNNGYIYVTSTIHWSSNQGLNLGRLCEGSNFELVAIKQFEASSFRYYQHEVSFGTRQVDDAMNGNSLTFIFRKKQ
jgi:hypothetical protein